MGKHSNGPSLKWSGAGMVPTLSDPVQVNSEQGLGVLGHEVQTAMTLVGRGSL